MSNAHPEVMRANKTTIGGAIVAAFVLTAIPLLAQQPATRDVTPQLVTAGVAVEDLHAVEVGGVVVLRGGTTHKTAAGRAGSGAQSLGVTSVAHLIQRGGV